MSQSPHDDILATTQEVKRMLSALVTRLKSDS
jgi:hypothetical protein